MILVLLGTQKQQFNRLLSYLEDIDVKDDIIIQKGYTTYNGKYKSFMFDNNLNLIIKKSDIIITHGGIGSIMECLEFKKKVIVVPRLKKYNEHVDNHQLEIVNSIKKYVMIATNKEELENALFEIKTKKLPIYKSNNINFNVQLESIIKKMIKE